MRAAFLAALLLAASAVPGSVALEVVRKALGLEAGAVEDLEGGDVLARVLDTEDRTEVMAVGALRARVDTRRFLDCVRDPRCLRQNDDVVRVGRVGHPARADDFAQLTLDPRHFAQLARCQLERCELRLARADIERFHRVVRARRFGLRPARLPGRAQAGGAPRYARSLAGGPDLQPPALAAGGGDLSGRHLRRPLRPPADLGAPPPGLRSRRFRGQASAPRRIQAATWK